MPNPVAIDDSKWEIPAHSIEELAPKKTKYCLVIPVINEGERIKKELKEIEAAGICDRVDVIIADGGSKDGSVLPEFLREMRVRTLMTKTGPGKLSAQLRMAYAYALKEGYEGIVTIDGNDKDGVEEIDDVVRELEAGIDFVQCSRFVPGGRAINTPKTRLIAIKLLHAPILSLAARFHFTDTTNGFRGYSSKCLLDPGLQPFRDIFSSYELLAYTTVRIPRLGYKCKEIACERRYPDDGTVPTKISPLSGNAEVFKVMLRAATGKYNP